MGEIFTPDSLFAGQVMPVLTGSATIAAGAGVLSRGTVLGRITKALDDVVAAADNTGDGTVAAVALQPLSQMGLYSLVCTKTVSAAGANDAVFAVYAPDGARLADATQAVAYANMQIGFKIGNAGTADFAVGDAFTIPVIAGAGTCVAVNSANVDGSQHAYAVLAESVDATLVAVTAGVYYTGEFNSHALAFGGLDTAAAHLEGARVLGIVFRTVMSA